ncbi:MAG TPA: hypothetical protein VGB64_10545 [Actinomycetota bacterium]
MTIKVRVTRMRRRRGDQKGGRSSDPPGRAVGSGQRMAVRKILLALVVVSSAFTSAPGHACTLAACPTDSSPGEGSLDATISDGVSTVRLEAYEGFGGQAPAEWRRDSVFVYVYLPGDQFYQFRLIDGLDEDGVDIVDVEVNSALLTASVHAHAERDGKVIFIDAHFEGAGVPEKSYGPGVGFGLLPPGVWASAGGIRRSATGVGDVSVTGTVDLIHAPASASIDNEFEVFRL